MAIKRYVGDKFVGLSSDTKPLNVPDGATFYETDTLIIYLKVSGAWSVTGLEPILSLTEYTPPLTDDDYFVIQDGSTSQNLKITYGDLQTELANSFAHAKKVYVEANADAGGNGSYLQPFNNLEDAFTYAATNAPGVAISVMPGTYYTNGNLSLPDDCGIISTSGQYMTNIVMNNGYEENNCFLVGSGGYVQGFTFRNQRVDSFENPTVGFAIAFRSNALILRSPYIRDISQVSNYLGASIAAPLDPANGNPLVGRGGGVLLADRAQLNQNSIFTYMLAFGATPRSPNGIGYCAKNGGGINGISSISIFQRCAFYALDGGQITLNNSGTQFGDISMRASGSTTIVRPAISTATLGVHSALSSWITTNKTAIIDDMWTYISGLYPGINETFTRRDAGNFLTSLSYDFAAGQQTTSRNFVAGFYDYKGDEVFNLSLLTAFTSSFTRMKTYITNNYSLTSPQSVMLAALVDDVVIGTLNDPERLQFGSLIESLGHQFNLAGAGVNKNALPLNFRKVGQPRSAKSSILEENGGRVRWSGSDELNNNYFAKGLRVNGRSGRLEGKPFTSAVRKIARRAANSRTM
jgi:hypothetical protein